MVTSSRMRSGLSPAPACSRALAPLVATLVRYWSFRMASAAAMLAGVSSTIRMVLSGKGAHSRIFLFPRICSFSAGRRREAGGDVAHPEEGGIEVEIADLA